MATKLQLGVKKKAPEEAPLKVRLKFILEGMGEEEKKGGS